MIKLSKDELWKGIIEDYIEDFICYFFPRFAKSAADFTKAPEFLEQELRDITPSEYKEDRYVDKLVKVYTKNGSEKWILLHIEVQGYKDNNFAERMFIYSYRIRDKYKKKIGALAIYTHDQLKYMPEEYTDTFEGKGFSFNFHVLKLKEETEDSLNIPDNPFSIALLVAKKAMEKENLGDIEQLKWKKELYEAYRSANYPKEKIKEILIFIRFYVRFSNDDYLEKFNEEINDNENKINNKSMGILEIATEKEKAYEKQKGIEQGIEKGIEQGIEQGIEKGINIGIRNLLRKGSLSVEEIADSFEVSTDYVLNIQKGIKAE